MKTIFKVLATLGTLAATVGTQGCVAIVMDEPKMPNSLLNK